MIAFDRSGAGEPLLLIHGTNCSRRIWDAVVPRLASHRDVIALDLPAHGESPPSSFSPPDFAHDVAELLDDLRLDAPAVVGHSVGGWTALELARLGRARAVLALAPAGLWRKHSPFLTDAGLNAGWYATRVLGRLTEIPLRSRPGRSITLRSLSRRPGQVPVDSAVSLMRDVRTSRHFPRHFRETRVLRFRDGDAIPGEVSVTVVWGDKDRIAHARRSRFVDELPPHVVVETWPDCGHTMVWDAPERTVTAALAL